MTDAPDRIWVFADTAAALATQPIYTPTDEYLLSTPTRIHAEELFEALRALVASDEPWSISWSRAQVILVRIEGEKP